MDNASVAKLIHTLHLDQWPMLAVLFVVLRALFGISYGLLYGYVAVLFFVRVKVEQMLMMFFVLVIGFYVTGQHVEANHYMSFVYGLMFLKLILFAWELMRSDRNSSV